MSEELQAELARLNSLKDILLFDERTTFAQFGNYGLFVPDSASFSSTFMNWRPHERMDPRDFMLRDAANKSMEKWSVDTTKIQNSDCRVYLSHVFAALKRARLSFGLFDIGGYLGLYSVLADRMAKEMGIRMPIKCFEPGPTQKLIQANADVNSIADFELRPVAVSDVTGPMLYRYSAGETIVGGIHRKSNEYARIAYSTRIDEEFTNSFNKVKAVIAKIDVEGFEPEVLTSIGKYAKRIPVLIIEVQPWARNKVINGKNYLTHLRETYHIVEIGNAIWPHEYRRIEPGQETAYFDDVAERSPPVSDMICIRKDLKGAAQLAGTLGRLNTRDRTGQAHD